MCVDFARDGDGASEQQRRTREEKKADPGRRVSGRPTRRRLSLSSVRYILGKKERGEGEGERKESALESAGKREREMDEELTIDARREEGQGKDEAKAHLRHDAAAESGREMVKLQHSSVKPSPNRERGRKRERPTEEKEREREKERKES